MSDSQLRAALCSAIRARIPKGKMTVVADQIAITRTYLWMLLNGRAKSLPALLRVASDLGIDIEVRVDGKVI